MLPQGGAKGGTPVRNLLVMLRFDGRGYHGWQVQRNALTVMAAFQDALESLFGCRPDVKGCSRTDAGVSALEYGVSFFLDNPIPCERLVRALNSRLPAAIAAMSCREVPADFHARYACLGKRYCYRVLNAPEPDPFWAGLALHWPHPLDEALLGREAQAFVGRRDFSAFCNAGGQAQDPVRAVRAVSVTRRGRLVELRVTGDGFLYNMVRIMAGTLLDHSQGRIAPGEIPAILESRDRARAGITAPACGLILERVFYPWDPPEPPLGGSIRR